MKKFLTAVIATLSLSGAYALPLGNPTEASIYTKGIWCEEMDYTDPCDPCFSWCDAWSLRIGFYGDYVYNRNMKMTREVPNRTRKGDAQRVTLYTNAALLTLNICDCLDIFSTLGASTLTIREDLLFRATLLDFSLHDDHFSTAFSWSVGSRYTLWECGCFGIGAEAQYFRTNTELTALLATGLSPIYPKPIGAIYHEWQVGLGASYACSISCPSISLIPYLGVTYAKANLDPQEDIIDAIPFLTELQPYHNFQNDKEWSLVVGTTFTLCDVVGVSVEGRFAGEKALHVNGQFRF